MLEKLQNYEVKTKNGPRDVEKDQYVAKIQKYGSRRELADIFVLLPPITQETYNIYLYILDTQYMYCVVCYWWTYTIYVLCIQ